MARDCPPSLEKEVLNSDIKKTSAQKMPRGVKARLSLGVASLTLLVAGMIVTGPIKTVKSAPYVTRTPVEDISPKYETDSMGNETVRGYRVAFTDDNRILRHEKYNLDGCRTLDSNELYHLPLGMTKNFTNLRLSQPSCLLVLKDLEPGQKGYATSLYTRIEKNSIRGKDPQISSVWHYTEIHLAKDQKLSESSERKN